MTRFPFMGQLDSFFFFFHCTSAWPTSQFAESLQCSSFTRLRHSAMIRGCTSVRLRPLSHRISPFLKKSKQHENFTNSPVHHLFTHDRCSIKSSINHLFSLSCLFLHLRYVFHLFSLIRSPSVSLLCKLGNHVMCFLFVEVYFVGSGFRLNPGASCASSRSCVPDWAYFHS